MTEKPLNEAEIFLNAALHYAGLGLKVIPLYPINHKGYCSCGMGRDCSSPGKHPKTKTGLKDASGDIEQIKKWWPVESVLPNNIGILTGGKIGLVVVDIDGAEGFAALSKERVEDLKKATVPCVKTGRGFHYYFRSKTPIKTKPGFVSKVDIKADGGYVVAPPSNHISGVSYEWVNKPIDGFLDAPPWVFNGKKESVPHRFNGITKKDFMHESIPKGYIRVNGQDIPISEIGKKDVPATEAANKDVPDPKTDDSVIPEGYRNDTLFKVACRLRKKNVSFDAALESLEKVNRLKCNPPLSESEVKSVLDSAFKYEPGKSDVFNCTDLGNAKRLVLRYGDKIRYCYAWKNGWFGTKKLGTSTMTGKF